MKGKITLMVRLLFLVAFVWLGVKALMEQKVQTIVWSDGSRVLIRSEATTDGYIKALLSSHKPGAATLQKPTKALVDAVSKFPSDGALLFVGPRNDQSYLLMWLINSYLGWPRLVYPAGCDNAYGWEQVPPSAHISGVIFYLSAPPASMPRGQTILPGMVLIPVSEKAAWIPYCSR